MKTKLKKILIFSAKHFHFVLLAIVLLISGIAHGYNMFHYPYYENDEGTYMSQAWSFLTQGKLAPYTYWYDHAPAGWIFIAFWVMLTGGFHTFGLSVNSGRVFMLALHLLTTFFLFEIGRKLSKNSWVGAISALIFSLSPLGIYFQRRVLLDNIMIFWVFLSLWLLIREKIKLSHIYLSAISLAIAILTKENAVFFVPAFLYVIYSRTHVVNRKIALLSWTIIVASLVSLYFLYAFLKSEFFPVGFGGNYSPHVSLVTTFENQFGRGSTMPFWSPKSDFYQNLSEWFRRDIFMISTGVVSTILSALIAVKNKSLRIPFLFAALFWLFLLRGKLVIDFYIVPLLPLLTLNLAMVVDVLTSAISFRKRLIQIPLLILFVGWSSYYLYSHPIGQYTNDETTPQIRALSYVESHVPKNATMAIDNYALVDLRDAGYQNADWFWKIWSDPEIQAKYNNDWKNISYLMLSHEMLHQMGQRLGQPDDIRSAYTNSKRIAMFGPDENTYIDFTNYVTTNGDWIAVYKLLPENQLQLSYSWDYYKQHFIHSYGQVIDPSTNNTTSEGQSYAMLRAVWTGDHKAFDGVWAWTRDHMQHRSSDYLLSWLWTKQGNSYKQSDSTAASDADEDIALSLLFAYKKWNNPTYLNEAKQIIPDIWKTEVVEYQPGEYVLVSGSNSKETDSYLINPSYFSPAAYRIFSQVDPVHPWNELADNSYSILNQIQLLNGGNSTLPPNWLTISTQTGQLSSAASYRLDANVYSFDAFRTFWRIALDASWFKNQSAISYLQSVSPVLANELNQSGEEAAITDINGIPQVNYTDLSTTTGALSVFDFTDKNLAAKIYSSQFKNAYKQNSGYWADGNNYYEQNWAWFATAMYTNNLPNLWQTNASLAEK